MKKKLLVLVIFTLLIGMTVILTGCGNKGTNESVSTEQNNQSVKEFIETTADKLDKGDTNILKQIVDVDGNISLMAKDFPDSNSTALDLSDAKDYKFEELYSFVKDIHKNGKQNINKYSDLMNRLGIKENEVENIQKSFNEYEEQFYQTIDVLQNLEVEINNVSEEIEVYQSVYKCDIDVVAKYNEVEENGSDTIYIMKEDNKYYILALNSIADLQKTSKTIQNSSQDLGDAEKETFNMKFTHYEGTNVSGTNVGALISSVMANNQMNGADQQITLTGDVKQTSDISKEKTYNVKCNYGSNGFVNSITITAN